MASMYLIVEGPLSVGNMQEVFIKEVLRSESVWIIIDSGSSRIFQTRRRAVRRS